MSAAEAYGASPYAVMVNQVMVSGRRRPITVGRQQMEFHTRARIADMARVREVLRELCKVRLASAIGNAGT